MASVFIKMTNINQLLLYGFMFNENQNSLLTSNPESGKNALPRAVAKGAACLLLTL